MKRVKEDKIQEWLENNYKNIIDLIRNSDIINDINNKSDIFGFSLDFLVYQKMMESYKYVYNNLSEILDLVIANKNISMNKQERLYPDLLLFNPETATFIIVEIKRSDKAEREAITELLAYEHELQNLFPFMSKIEVYFILISADYKPLLEHSLSSLTLWQNRKILPLRIEGIESENEDEWKLFIHEPNESWSLLSNGYIKPNQIDTIHLVLYDKNAYTEGYKKKIKENDLQIIKRGIELIISEGEKNNANGFVLILQATTFDITSWDIIIGVLSPYSFLELVKYESKIKDFFLENYSADGYHSKNTIDLALNAQKYLKTYFDPMFEGMSKWDITRREIEQNSNPILIDFFGEINTLVNSSILNKRFRDYYCPELNTRNGFDWKNPLIGLNILDNLTGKNIFFHGEFSFFTLYQFGKELGILWQYLHIIQSIVDPDNNPYTDYFYGKYKWAEISFLKSYREIIIRYSEIKDNKTDSIVFKSIKEDINENFKNIEEIFIWIRDIFLKRKIHKKAFILGFQIKNYFYDKNFLAGEEEITIIEDLIVSETKQMINKQFEQEEFVQNFLIDKVKEYKKILALDDSYDYSKISKDKIINIFETHTLPLYSDTIFEVYHKTKDIDKETVDISYIKKVYPKEYEKNKQIAICLSSNGNLGIVNILDEEKDLFQPILHQPINPKKELMFMQVLDGGIKIVNKLTWEEFEKKFD